MRLTHAKEWAVKRLGAMEGQTFERARLLGERFLVPMALVAVSIVLSQELYRHVLTSEHASILESALQRAEQMPMWSTGRFGTTHERADQTGLREAQQRAAGYTIETVTNAALALGIRLDEVESGVRCNSHDALSEQQIQISFMSSFSQMRQLYDYLNGSRTDLVTESIVVERAKLLSKQDTVVVKFCIGVVTETSWSDEKSATAVKGSKHAL